MFTSRFALLFPSMSSILSFHVTLSWRHCQSTNQRTSVKAEATEKVWKWWRWKWRRSTFTTRWPTFCTASTATIISYNVTFDARPAIKWGTNLRTSTPCSLTVITRCSFFHFVLLFIVTTIICVTSSTHRTRPLFHCLSIKLKRKQFFLLAYTRL